jgi:trimeric autotransporter adhesin
MKLYLIRLFTIVSITIVSFNSNAQVSGRIFRDINGDGTRQVTNPEEPWEFGVIVRAYNATNVLLASTSSNPAGNYSFSAAQLPAGIPVRIEFIVAAGDQPAKRNDNIRFVVPGGSANNINFAVASNKTFSNDANPYVATNVYTNGEANSSGTGTAGNANNLLIFPYNMANDGGNARRAANKHLGAVFGMAWQRQSRTLFMAAYLKRHASFGPGGIGAIYETQISANGIPSTPSLFINVTALGINVGTDPRTPGALPTQSSLPNTDMGVFGEVGKRGIGGIDLTIDGREMYLVNMYEKKLHRINIGNPLKTSFTSADVTGNWNIPNPNLTGTEWHPMALEIYKGKIYVGGVTTKETTTAHNPADTANLRGIVYEFDPIDGTFKQVLNFALSYRRGFTNTDYRYEFRNNYWSAWQNNGNIPTLRAGLIGSTTGSNATGMYYPQPMLCNIEFDVDGSMVLGVRDRFGDQAGYANLMETGNVPGETYRGLASGEVLRAGKDGDEWNIENNGKVTSNGVTINTPALADNTPLNLGSFLLQLLTPWGGNMGPGGGYYYYNQNFTKTGVPAPFATNNTNTSHYVKSNGGILIYPGYNEVLNTAIDPVATAFTNGIIRNFNTGSNAGNMSGRLQLLPAPVSNDASTMGKAAALGDLELLLDAEVMEIGNLVWYDANTNGRQDAHELGIPGIKVKLRSPGLDNSYNTSDDEVWELTTDAGGHYYFDETIVNDARRPASWIGVSNTNSGILPGFEYKIEIDRTQPALAGYFPIANDWVRDEIDSDGIQAGNLVTYTVNPGGSAAADSKFSNNYNIDFGFAMAMLASDQLKLKAVQSENDVTVKWQTTNENNVTRYYVERSLNGSNYSAIGVVNSKGNGDFSYQLADNINGVVVPVVYYRLRIESNNAAPKYSSVVTVIPGNRIKFTIGPNPFIDVLNIQVNNNAKGNADIRMYSATAQLVHKSSITLEKGVNNFSINDFRNLAKGLYIFEIRTGETIYQQKILKQ